MNKADLFSRLESLDYEASLLYPNIDTLSLTLVGGGALVLLEVVSRSTHDLDALVASKPLRNILEKYDINGDVSAYSSCFPFKYEDRLIPIYCGSKVNVFTASLEDIVVSKLFALRDQDIQDIQSETVLQKINWEMLERLALAEDEVRANVLNEHAYNIFKLNYEDYVRRYRP